MANKITKEVKEIQADGLKKAMAEKTIEWCGLEIKIKPILGLKEVMEFVDNVSSSCFNDNGDYIPEVKDFAIKHETVTKYSNLTMPEDVSVRYELLYALNAYEEIACNIDAYQYQTIIDAVEDKIQYMVDSNITAIKNKVDKLIDKLESIHNDTNKIFDGMSPEDIANLSNSIVNGGISADKIVSAYMETVKK